MSFIGSFIRAVTEWRRIQPWVRVTLGALACAVAVRLESTPLAAAAAGFLIYAATLALRGGGQEGVFGLLALFADAVFFLAAVSLGAGAEFWFGPAYYLYLMVAAVESYGLIEVALLASVIALFSFVVQLEYLDRFRRTAAVAGALACLFAFRKQQWLARNRQMEAEAKRAHAAAAGASKNERQRIAADFHDGPLQSFISFHMRLEILRKVLERDQNAGLQELQELRDISKAQIRDLRSFVRSMRPVEVDANLPAALRRLAEEFQKESGISVTYSAAEGDFTIEQEVAGDVVQMVREALHNVMKHARASRVALAVERNGKELVISVDDNGAGFEFSGAYNLDEMEMLRLGPVSLKQRARALNAGMTLESRPGRGAGVKLRIPL